jgi:cytochrome b561
MALRSTTEYWGSVTRALHWLIAITIIGLLSAGLYASSLDVSTIEGDRRYFEVIDLHKSLGLIVIVLAALRVLWRASERTPSPPADMPRWEVLLARLAQILLYLGMFLIPVTGFLWATSYGEPLRFFGVKLPTLVHAHGANATLAHHVHVIAAFVLTGIVSLHLLGALKNHFVSGNDVLRKMLGIDSGRAEE